MINKNIDDISYEDIIYLLENKFDESDILEYKSEMIRDDDLIKQVCSFANTRGGYVVFGVKESGNGGHPIEIVGIESSMINKERIEQILLSHIVPRLNVKIKSVEMPNSKRIILIIQVPNIHQKPHQHAENEKFYKRFNFQFVPMAENEISHAYKNRFSNHQEVKQYLEDTNLKLNPNLMGVKITTIPSSIEYRLFEPTEYDEIETLQSIKIPSYFFDNSLPNHFLEPFAHGVCYHNHSNNLERFEMHRNGCVQYVNHYNSRDGGMFYCPTFRIAIKIMQILEFTGVFLSRYNYFGDVEIIVSLQCSDKSMISSNVETRPLDSLNAKINREHPLEYIQSEYSKIASSVMNEIYNHFGLIKSDLFDADGNWTRNR